MLNWGKQFSILLFLDNNNYPSVYSGYECLLGAGAKTTVSVDGPDKLAGLQQFHDTHSDWLFGHITYDFKNELERKLATSHPCRLGFPTISFFQPEVVCYIDRDATSLTIESFDDPQSIYQSISNIEIEEAKPLPKLKLTKVIDRSTYLETIGRLRSHIAEGDCYEINFCNEGFCEHADVAPLHVFHVLNKVSPAPFAAYYRLEDRYMMCASPERYLRKDDNILMSQPIKGTARRDADPQKDASIKEDLVNDIKERAENVMIVDLVRNDLSRCCETASILVDELFGIYSFPQVHQMISTVSGTLRNDVPFTDAIKYSFPMGSMTGAPKYKVMQLIDHYERSARELFSGTVGYITPSGDFDFNVVIRSLFYNASTQYLSYQTGGAITYDSVAEKEWDEMQLKAAALEKIFAAG